VRIPEKGIPKDELFAKMQAYRADDMNWRDGRVWAYVYDPGREAEEVIKQAYMSFLSENALDPTVFPSVLRFENELVAMAASHLNGDDDVVGNFTSGGTESIMLAVKTARALAPSCDATTRAASSFLPATVRSTLSRRARVRATVDPMLPAPPEYGDPHDYFFLFSLAAP